MNSASVHASGRCRLSDAGLTNPSKPAMCRQRRGGRVVEGAPLLRGLSRPVENATFLLFLNHLCYTRFSLEIGSLQIFCGMLFCSRDVPL